MVVELVDKYGPKRWTQISKHLQGRTGKQCRERWHNHLNPCIDKSAWTEEEDHKILILHKQMGNRWAEIAKYLPGRYVKCLKSAYKKSAQCCRIEHFTCAHALKFDCLSRAYKVIIVLVHCKLLPCHPTIFCHKRRLLRKNNNSK